MKKTEKNMSILGREFVPVGNKFNLNSHSFPFAGTAMFPSSSKGGNWSKLLICLCQLRRWDQHQSTDMMALRGQLIICNSKLLLNFCFFQFIVWYARSSLLQEEQWVKDQWKIIFQTRCLLSFIKCMSKIKLCKYLIRQLCSNFKVLKKLQGTLHICSVIAALELVKNLYSLSFCKCYNMYYGPALFFFILVMGHSGNQPKKAQ